jgi:uncharacterized repeat protein (TIGR01451 family)/CSLREA domain-containing protein
MKEAFAMKRGELFKVLALLWAFICIVYAAPALAQPWTITVTTNADNNNAPWTDCPPPGTNDCSLREAILVANFNGAPGDVIVFDSSLDGATITLSTVLGGLWIGGDTDTTINAISLATGITIDANGIASPLSLNSAYINIWGQITITNAGAGGTAVALNPGADVAWLQGVTVTNNAGAGIYLNGVNTVTISNSSISGNDAEGVVVRDSSVVSIDNSTVSNNGQNGLSSGVFIVGTSSVISVGPYNLIENNGGNGITVIEDFNTDNAPTIISVFANTVRGNGFLAGDGAGIQIAGAVSFVDIGGNEIYGNAAQGILVERTPAGSNGPQNINIVPAPWNGALLNYIYSNGQEGILIRDLGTQNNVVRGNWIGVDPSGNPAPNGNSGIALVGGTTNNVIERNTIRYNQYQDVLISGAGTSYNTLQNNDIYGGTDVSPPVGYDNVGVVIINGATNNTVSGNGIAYHVYDGVQVVGPGTDGNQIIGGNRIYDNGRGVAVINDYPDAAPPDPDAPPFDLQTDSFTAPGPANTLISESSIFDNNGDGILVRRDGGGTVIQNNYFISNNQADGIRLVGASPSIENNTITDNAENGIHALVFFGQDDSPATASDDVLSQPTITGNTMGGNGAWGVFAIDTRLPQDFFTINDANSWASLNGVGRFRQDWYGYVRVIDSRGNPVTGLTVAIEGTHLGGVEGCGPHTSSVSDPSGNYGPAGFTINSARSYFPFTSFLGFEMPWAPYGEPMLVISMCVPPMWWNVYVQSDPSIGASYGYDGDFNPAVESGGAIESPPGSGVDRYQYAELIQPLAPEADLEISKVDSPDPVTVGENLTYTITVTNRGPDAAANVVVTDTLPSGVTFVSASPECVHVAGVVTCNLGNIPAGGSVTITIVVTPTAPGTISNTARVTSDTLDPNTDNSSDEEPTEVQSGPIGGDPPIWGSIMVFPSPEVHYGRGPNQDLNRNKRLDDCVLRYRDLQTGRIVDTKVFVSCTPKDLDIYEQTIVFVDDEKYLGMYDLGTGAVHRTPYKAAHPAIWGRTVVFESDGQIALWNIDADRVEMISSGSQPTIWEDLVVFVGSSGTLWLYDLRQRQLRDTGVRGDQPVIYEKIVAFTALDASGRPLIRYYDVATQTVRDTGAVGSHPAVFGRFIVFQTDEAALGLDLTGDGDRLDTVIRYYDLEAGQAFNTGQLGFEPDIYEDLITFWVFEPRVQQDLNGDGDREDPIVQVYRIREGGSALPLRVTGLRVEREARALRFRALGEGIEAIRVQIYDLQGREVYTTQFVPGSQLVWRLQSTDGHPVANGVYLAVISVKGADAIYRSAVQKIVVLR